MNIIINGATSGIGRALFEKYAVDGNCIGIVGRRANLLDEQYKQHPDNTFTSTADEHAKGNLRTEHFGRISGTVYNCL